MAREHEESSGTGKEVSRSRTGGDIDGIAEEFCKFYKKGEYLDEALFDRIQEDFQEWSDTDIATIRKSTLQRIVATVQLYRVYILSTRDVKQEFIRTVRSEEESPEWLKDELPEGVRLFSSRFVDEVKNKGTDKAYEKSRLVI